MTGREKSRAERELLAQVRTDRPHRYNGPALSREHVMRLLVDHGVWEDVGTVRASRLTDALLLLIRETTEESE